MSVALDILRSLAAITVLIGHAVQLKLYTGPWPFDDTFQHGAVVVFFVLSGFLIHRSATRTASLRSYAVARIARILPVAAFAVCFAAAVYWLLSGLGIAPTDPRVSPRISVGALIVPLLFLSERWTALRPALDPPYWSLCYEVWFYVIFGAWFYLRGPIRWVVLCATATIAGVTVLLLLPAWLLGVGASVALRRGVTISRPPLTIVVTATLVLLLVGSGAARVVSQSSRASVGLPDLEFSNYWIVDTGQAALLALAVVAIGSLRSAVPTALLMASARPARWFAALTFTLYLLHWPILTLLHATGITAGNSLVAFGPILLMPVAVAALLAPTLEGRWSRRLRQWLDRVAAPDALAARSPPSRWREDGGLRISRAATRRAIASRRSARRHRPG